MTKLPDIKIRNGSRISSSSPAPGRKEKQEGRPGKALNTCHLHHSWEKVPAPHRWAQGPPVTSPLLPTAALSKREAAEPETALGLESNAQNQSGQSDVGGLQAAVIIIPTLLSSSTLLIVSFIIWKTCRRLSRVTHPRLPST